MFRNRVRLRGKKAAITWAYHTAAALHSWTVARDDDGWKLSAAIDRADPFMLKQRPLLFTAPRQGGRWCWPVVAVTVGREQLTATLGPPEH